MSKLSVLNIKGEKVKDITLNKEVWGITPNDAVLYDAIILAQASLRQGTHKTKTRSEVSGGGRKPWRQKGTGRARQGSTRAPHWVGGGVVFGPQPRDYSKKQNRKERRLALKSALTYKAIDNNVIVLDNLVLETPKTKEMLSILETLKLDSKTLFVTVSRDENAILASRNLRTVNVLEPNELNALEIVSVDKLVVTEEALKAIEEVLI